MSQNSEPQLDSSTTTHEPQLDISISEQGMSRDEADTSPAAASESRSVDRESCVAPARLDEPPPRFRMNDKLRAEILSSELPDVMPVKCGQLEGELHVKRLGSGSRGPCILLNGVWLTPNQFECQGGQGYFRYWKRSIRHGTKPLDCYIKLGLIKLHYRFCACERCSEPITDAPQRLRLNKVLIMESNTKDVTCSAIVWAWLSSHPCSGFQQMTFRRTYVWLLHWFCFRGRSRND